MKPESLITDFREAKILGAGHYRQDDRTGGRNKKYQRLKVGRMACGISDKEDQGARSGEKEK
jgi:hypothetical protein